MPAQGSRAALDEFKGNIDILKHIVSSYKSTHTVTIAGDLNASLIQNKPDDLLLHSFIHEFNFSYEKNMGVNPIFRLRL